MINALPKKYGEYLFNPAGLSARSGFNHARDRLTQKFQNPIFRQIHFHTFRYFRAIMEYAKDRGIPRVQHLLGHKRLENTEIYTHLTEFKPEEYTIKRSRRSKEEDELLEAGFQYVRYDDKDQCPVYRKRK